MGDSANRLNIDYIDSDLRDNVVRVLLDAECDYSFQQGSKLKHFIFTISYDKFCALYLQWKDSTRKPNNVFCNNAEYYSEEGLDLIIKSDQSDGSYGFDVEGSTTTFEYKVSQSCCWDVQWNTTDCCLHISIEGTELY